MKKPEITKGEWKISRQVSTLVVGKTHDGYERSVASAGGYSRHSSDVTTENQANARAISAAPEMIDALVEFQRRYSNDVYNQDFHKQVEQALKKAGCGE